jgi:ribosomal protein S6
MTTTRIRCLHKPESYGSLVAMTKENNRDVEREERLKVYELGFHFVPTLSEDDVTVKFSELKSFVEKLGGEFISEDSPKPISLAYDISKTVKAVKKWYKNAYFGWVKFTLAPEDIETLEKQVKEFEPVLRYLLISTVRESTLAEVARERNGRSGRPDASEDSPEGTPAAEGVDVDSAKAKALETDAAIPAEAEVADVGANLEA